MQFRFSREAMAQPAAFRSRIVKRHVTRSTSNGQRPVGNPHFRVARIRIGQSTGGTIPVCPTTLNTPSDMRIMERPSRTAFERGMTPRRGAAVDISVPQIMLTRRMTGDAIAAASGNTRLQVRDGSMAEAAISSMGDINR